MVVDEKFIDGILELEAGWTTPTIEKRDDGSIYVASYNSFGSSKIFDARDMKEAEVIRKMVEERTIQRRAALPTLEQIAAALPELDRLKEEKRGKPEFQKICNARGAAYRLCGYTRDPYTGDYIREKFDPLAEMPKVSVVNR